MEKIDIMPRSNYKFQVYYGIVTGNPAGVNNLFMPN